MSESLFSITLDKLNSAPVRVEYQSTGLMKVYSLLHSVHSFNTSIEHIEAGYFKLLQFYRTFLKNPFDILHN